MLENTNVTMIKKNPEFDKEMKRMIEKAEASGDEEMLKFLKIADAQIDYLVDIASASVPLTDVMNKALRSAISAIQHMANDWSMVASNKDFTPEVTEHIEQTAQYMNLLAEMQEEASSKSQDKSK